jgi:hypothetical protein
VRIRRLGKFGAVLQLTVLLLVQFTTVAPGLARALHHQAQVAHCCGDHVKCGCSPERVAARCCCCYLNKRTTPAAAETAGKHSGTQVAKHSCGMTSAAMEKHHDADDLDRSTPAFSSIPCGCDPGLTPATAESLKFLSPASIHLATLPIFEGKYLSNHHSFTSRYVPPPDPPPKLATLS